MAGLQNQRFRLYVVKDPAMLDDQIQAELNRFLGWKIINMDIISHGGTLLVWALWEPQL